MDLSGHIRDIILYCRALVETTRDAGEMLVVLEGQEHDDGHSLTDTTALSDRSPRLAKTGQAHEWNAAKDISGFPQSRSARRLHFLAIRSYLLA